MDLTDKQKELYSLFDGSTSIMAEGGGRSGKTMALIWAIVLRAVKNKKTDHLILRFRFAHAKQSICYQTFPKLQELSGLKFSLWLNKTDWFYSLPNGSRIWIGGADDKERTDKILGKEYATIFFNEASQISYETVETVSTRLNPPEGVKGKIFYDLNPPSRNHFLFKIFHERKFPDGRPVPDNDYKWLKMNPADNRYVSKQYLETLSQLSASKRARFLDGEWSTDTGSLWKRAWINYDNAERNYQRIVIGVDPSGSTGGDEIGIIAAGKFGNEYRILDDDSCHGTPNEWSEKVANMYKKWKADLVVAERNYGGDMVEHTIRTAYREINIKLVTSSRGKILRAEPISALYEQGKVKHRVPFTELEDEYCTYSEDTKESPNRMDAAVFALTELSGHSGGGVSTVQLKF